MKRYLWFAVSYLFKIFSMFFTGMFIINMFVLFFILIGRTKDLSIMEALDALRISSIITTTIIILGVVISSSLRKEFSRMMKFYPPIIHSPFHTRKLFEK